MGRLKILVVDDSESNRKLLCSLVNKSGHECDYAEDGREALHKLEENDYDLVFMDLQMPLMSGDKVTKHVRTKFPFPKNRVKIIAITAYQYREFFDDFHDVGFNDIITKPYTIQKVTNIINYQNIISSY